VKNWQNLLSFGLHALKNLGEFPQTESGICIIFRENDYRNIRLFNPFQEGRLNLFSSMKFIIDVSMNLVLTQSLVKMTCKTIAGVCASKTEEHIVLPIRRSNGRSGSHTKKGLIYV
jgi:hypothetical protein